MRTIQYATLSFCCLALASKAAESAVQLPVPTPQQLAWHEAGIGLFFHWAPNVYQGGEGDNRSTPRDQINPDRFDAAQWTRAVQAAGAGYLIFVAKHVGGYCAWQTKTTDYSLKSSSWKQGRGDMLAELAQACQEKAVRLGVYFSPRDDTHGADTGGRAGSPEKQAAYNELYRQQLTELLTQYGPMFEMWFDGGNIVPINDLIDKLSPGIISFQGRRTGGSRWVGTEHGFAPYPCWNTISWKEGETPKEGAGSPTGNLWCPAECDVSIIRPRWFWSPGCDHSILSLDALVEIYYLSVGHGVNLLLNATPDSHGEVPAAQMQRLQEFGDEIRARFGKPLFTTKGEGNNLALDLGRARTIDHIALREDIAGGERIRKFIIEGRRADGKWVALARGTQVGSRQIIPIPEIAVTNLRLTVQETHAPVLIRELSAFYVNRPVPPLAYREGGRPAMRAPGISRSRDGHFAVDCPTPDWEIRYTLDGRLPTVQAPLYTVPIQLSSPGTIRAQAFRDGRPSSVIMRATFDRILLRPEVFLDELPMISMKSGNEQPKQETQMRKNCIGKPLRLGGVTYERGLGDHAGNGFAAELVYALKPEYKRFVSLVGVDDQTAGRGTLGIQVFVDNQLKTKTPVLRGGQPPHCLEVDLPQGARQLRLVIDDAGDGYGYDDADFVNAGFVVGPDRNNNKITR